MNQRVQGLWGYFKSQFAQVVEKSRVVLGQKWTNSTKNGRMAPRTHLEDPFDGKSCRPWATFDFSIFPKGVHLGASPVFPRQGRRRRNSCLPDGDEEGGRQETRRQETNLRNRETNSACLHLSPEPWTIFLRS